GPPDRTDRHDPHARRPRRPVRGREMDPRWCRAVPRADDHARAVDTRIRPPRPAAPRLHRATRAEVRGQPLKRAGVPYLVGGMKPGVHDDVISEAATEFERRDARTQELARRFTIRGRVAVVDTAGAQGQFDKTDLLLAGQARAPVAIVRDSGMLTIAAGF